MLLRVTDGVSQCSQDGSVNALVLPKDITEAICARVDMIQSDMWLHANQAVGIFQCYGSHGRSLASDGHWSEVAGRSARTTLLLT